MGEINCTFGGVGGGGVGLAYFKSKDRRKIRVIDKKRKNTGGVGPKILGRGGGLW